jgi:hypothetical protein
VADLGVHQSVAVEEAGWVGDRLSPFDSCVVTSVVPANLWWPDDRAWCVATEIDLAWTYVGGPAALIGDVLANPHLEAQPASPAHNHRQRLPEWLTPAIEAAATKLLESGRTTLETWRGSLDAQLDLPHGQTDGDLRIQRRPSTGFPGSSWSRVSERDPVRLRHHVTAALTWAILELL